MRLLDIVFPKRCVSCGLLGSYICHQCSENIVYYDVSDTICPVCQKAAALGLTHSRCKNRYTPDGLTSYCRYDGVIKSAIKQLKYRFVRDIAQDLVTTRMQEKSKDIEKRMPTSHIVPIPLHRKKRRQRGYNQAELLAQEVFRDSQIDVRPDLLRRITHNASQAEISERSKRRQNMKGAFAAESFDNETITSIILFDDVYTTGATLLEATKTLKQAGVEYVWGVTIAR